MSDFPLNKQNGLCVALSPERVFLGLSILFGLTFVFVNAPFQTPDEESHFRRAYHVFQGDLIAKRQGNVVGGYIPKAVAYAFVPYEYLWGHPDRRVDTQMHRKNLGQPFDKDEKVFINLFFPALYAPIVYLPQAIGIAIGSVFDLSTVKLMYAGRISALMCWIAMVYMAIRIMPVFQWVFFLVALQPRSLFQASSLSADGPTNAMVILLTALILRAIFGREANLEKKMFWLIVILSVLLSLAKQVYLPLVGLVFLIPSEKFKSRRNKILFCGVALAAACLATGLWSMIIRPLYTPFNGADAPQQMSLLMAHPWTFPVIAIKSVFVHWRGLFFSFIGVLGYLDVWLPGWIYKTYPLALIAVALFDGMSGKPLKWFWRCWILLLCFASFLLIELSMFLTWTKPGATIVDGVHGRYFIPLIIPTLLALFYNSRLRVSKTSFYPLFVELYSFIVLAVSCWTVWARFYGPLP